MLSNSPIGRLLKRGDRIDGRKESPLQGRLARAGTGEHIQQGLFPSEVIVADKTD
jgi:hypothetical protein